MNLNPCKIKFSSSISLSLSRSLARFSSLSLHPPSSLFLSQTLTRSFKPKLHLFVSFLFAVARPAHTLTEQEKSDCDRLHCRVMRLRHSRPIGLWPFTLCPVQDNTSWSVAIERYSDGETVRRFSHPKHRY